jgi:hypothetical protein
MNEVQAARALGALSTLGPRTELAAAQALQDLRHGLSPRRRLTVAEATAPSGPGSAEPRQVTEEPASV